MTTRFFCSADTAHALTKAAKKSGYYFRTLTRTDNGTDVFCEASEPMMTYIEDNAIEVTKKK